MPRHYGGHQMRTVQHHHMALPSGQVSSPPRGRATQGKPSHAWRDAYDDIFTDFAGGEGPDPDAARFIYSLVGRCGPACELASSSSLPALARCFCVGSEHRNSSHVSPCGPQVCASRPARVPRGRDGHRPQGARRVPGLQGEERRQPRPQAPCRPRPRGRAVQRLWRGHREAQARGHLREQ